MNYIPRDLPKYVYFLRRKDGIGPIKIGCSRLPHVRLREFYRWSPYELEMVASAPGEHSVERQLHRMFAAYHLHMEWFAPNDLLLGIIEDVIDGATIQEAIALAEAVPVRETKAA